MTSYKKRTTRYLNLNIRVLKYCKHNELKRLDMIIVTAFTITIVVVAVNNMTTTPTNPTTTAKPAPAVIIVGISRTLQETLQLTLPTQLFSALYRTP